MRKIFYFLQSLFFACLMTVPVTEVEARECQFVCDAWDKTCVVCPKGSPGSTPPPARGGATNEVGPSTDTVTMTMQQCQTDLVAAQYSCDENQDAGYQSAESTIKNFALQMGSSMGVAGACSTIGKLIAGANGAVFAFSQLCSSARSKCMASCNKAKVAVMGSPTGYVFQNQVNDNLKSCTELDAKVQQASAAIANTVGTLRGAQSCEADTSTDLYNYCKSNPTALGCSTAATDCSNPAVAASNPICICKANPSSEVCTGAALKAGGGFVENNSLGTSAAATSSTGGLDVDGLIDDLAWAGDPNLKADGSRAEDVGGSKGGRPLQEGGASSGGAEGGGAGGGAGSGTAVNAGFRGGGSGGGGWSSGGGGGNAWSGGSAPAPGTPSAPGGPDLRQFLPGGKFDPKTRGLAGLTGPDGITGPHTDIWKKIQNRYQVERPKLMP